MGIWPRSRRGRRDRRHCRRGRGGHGRRGRRRRGGGGRLVGTGRCTWMGRRWPGDSAECGGGGRDAAPPSPSVGEAVGAAGDATARRAVEQRGGRRRWRARRRGRVRDGFESSFGRVVFDRMSAIVSGARMANATPAAMVLDENAPSSQVGSRRPGLGRIATIVGGAAGGRWLDGSASRSRSRSASLFAHGPLRRGRLVLVLCRTLGLGTRRALVAAFRGGGDGARCRRGVHGRDAGHAEPPVHVVEERVLARLELRLDARDGGVPIGVVERLLELLLELVLAALPRHGGEIGRVLRLLVHRLTLPCQTRGARPWELGLAAAALRLVPQSAATSVAAREASVSRQPGRSCCRRDRRRGHACRRGDGGRGRCGR